MNKYQQEKRVFLEGQLKWTKEQINLLDEMERKLNEMKKIVEYAAENEFSSDVRERLNNQLNVLTDEYRLLESKRHAILH